MLHQASTIEVDDPAADWAYNKGYRKGIINKVEEAFAALELIEDGKLESAVFTGLGVRGARAVVQAARPPGRAVLMAVPAAPDG